MNSQKCLVGVVYKPPKVGHFSEVEDVLIDLLPQYDHVILAGDLNINVLDNMSSETKHLLTALNCCNMSLLPLQATNHTRTSSSLIDLIAVNNPDKVLQFGQTSAPGLSTHDLIYLTYGLQVPKQKAKFILYRDIKNVKDDVLLADAARIPWHQISDLTDIDEKVNKFTDLVTELYDKHAPLKRIRVTKRPSPWLTEELRRQMENRDAAHRQFKKYRTAESFEEYRKLRNKTSQSVRNAKLKHTHSMASTNRAQTQIWKDIRQLGIIQGKHESTDIDIPLDELNRHFTISQSKLDQNQKEQTILKNISASPAAREKFYFSYVSPCQVRQSILRITSQAKGIDDINVGMLKKILDVILPTLTHIFNYSLMNGNYPKSWKQAIVKPIPKKTNPSDLNDYRGISILPVLSKALEHLVLKQIVDYLNRYKLLDPNQSGFRSGYSTCTALVKVTEDIREAMDKRQLTVLVLLDLSKAFDSVDVDILISKLRKLNFSGSVLWWMHSYLSDRTQSVIDNYRNTSSWRFVEAGVQQGSVLGPLLFSLYVNDIASCLRYSNHHLYADDLQLYVHTPVSNMEPTMHNLNNDLQSLTDWMSSHGLCLNPGKSQSMIIGHPKVLANLNKLHIPKLILQNVTIPARPTARNLGVIFDEHLSWTTHVAHICQKVFSILRILYKFKTLFTPQLRKRLVEALILPHVDYCDPVYSNVNTQLINKLQRAQNACIRFVCGLKFFDHVSLSYNQLAWLRIAQRRQFHTLCLLYRILSTRTPSYLTTKLHYLTSYHEHNTRADNVRLLSIPCHRTSLFTNSFSVISVRLWNQLPADIRGATSINSFKVLAKKHLLMEN